MVLVLSSALFVTYHNGFSLASLPYLIMGLSFGVAYMKTKRLEVAIAVHCMNNIFATILQFA